MDKKEENQADTFISKKNTYLLSNSLPMEEITLGETRYEVLKFLYKGGNTYSISKELKKSIPTTREHLFALRKKGLVKKGENDEAKYGEMWKITEKGKYLIEKCVGFPTKSKRIDNSSLIHNKGKKWKEDDINGHAFVFTLEVPKKLTIWKNREELMKEKGVIYKTLKIFGGGQGIILDGNKIHLTNKSIVFYDSESHMSQLAENSKSKAVNYFLINIKKIEKILNLKLSERGRYKFRVSRQHYALIQNALARQYNSENKKLEVYNGRGRLIYLIDNSQTEENIYGENHFEAVSPKTSKKDIVPAQNFFKSLNRKPITTDEIFEQFDEFKGMIKNLSEQDIQIGQVLKQVQENMITIVGEVAKLKYKK